MIIPFPCDPAILARLHALIGEALALSDAQHLHATGIALDTARLSVEDALRAGRDGAGEDDPGRLGRPINPVHNGADLHGRG